jgi:hypothetical protein
MFFIMTSEQRQVSTEHLRIELICFAFLDV